MFGCIRQLRGLYKDITVSAFTGLDVEQKASVKLGDIAHSFVELKYVPDKLPG